MGKKAEGPPSTAGSPVEERRALQDLLERYGLTLRGFNPQGETLLTDQGPYQVRRFSGSWDELAFVAAALSHLEQRGFTALRRLCLTADGQPGVPLGTGLYYLVAGEGGHRLELEGRGRLGRAAALLASFHDAGEGFPAEVPAERVRYLRWPEVLQERQADLQAMRREAVHSRGEFARLFLEYADDFLEQGDRALTGLLAAPLGELQRECAEHRQLAHRRFTPRKVRRVGQELLIDGWTHLALDLPAVDLATFVAKASGNDPDRAYALLEAYHDLRPISEAEWEVLVAWLRFPHQFWRLGHQHFHRRETHRSRLAKAIRQEVEREVFVETLALHWASEKLAPATPPSSPASLLSAPPVSATPDVPQPAGEPTSSEEREATKVSEPDELIGLGRMETPEPEEAPAQEHILPVEWPGEIEALAMGTSAEALTESPAEETLEEPAEEPAEEPIASETEEEPAAEPFAEVLAEVAEPVIEEPVEEPTPESFAEMWAEALELGLPSDGAEPEIALEAEAVAPAVGVAPEEDQLDQTVPVAAEPVVEEPVVKPVPEPSPEVLTEKAHPEESATPRVIVWRPFPPPLAPRW
ncbi:MAG TPA: hypothetical protein GXX28_12435 [Firmicutes bacterium]|nr:hypothetical protein [Bacillota bacterium]